MKSSDIYYQDQLAGRLWEDDKSQFHFLYNTSFLASNYPPITPNLPKRKEVFTSPQLFPVFYNMLAEGPLRELQEQVHKLETWDHFGLLRATARYDTIGAVTVKDSSQVYAQT